MFILLLLAACSSSPLTDSGDSGAPLGDRELCPVRYVDADGDGYGYGGGDYSCGKMIGAVVDVGGDCTDSDPEISPAAIEVCDGFDNDCDGDRDEGC